ncbi:hypothetical protein FS764_07820 [Agrobacterium vitis]|uniref:hypothetical protein n=1 Tax=Agrobacterium vitis TaxID=373 RepID=UPI001F33EDC4|nr:hypothetical protein [Agrobacterium vitis]MCF1466821.1 hypothetical protein [Agrobacterium vitis]
MKKTREERITDMMKRVRAADPLLWRHPVAEATVKLLEDGKPVTIESLIAHLEVTENNASALLRREISEAAIERLREIVVKKD